MKHGIGQIEIKIAALEWKILRTHLAGFLGSCMKTTTTWLSGLITFQSGLVLRSLLLRAWLVVELLPSAF